jgi:hypothetical protein
MAAVVCAVSAGGVWWYRSRAVTPAAMLKRMPVEGALLVYIDFSQLRSGGILQRLDGSKVGEDPEYRTFVRRTGFDYKRDLDLAIVSVAPTGKFLLLRGRFDWNSLRAYVENENGKCNNSFCRVVGSTPERRISFFPVQSNLMALAVSQDDSAAQRLGSVLPGPEPEVPDAPIWLSIPPSVAKSGPSLPAGTHIFARSLERAENVTLAFVMEGNRYAAKLNVRCSNDQDAVDIASQLSHSTTLLQQLIAREHVTPSPADLGGILSSGSFRSQGRRVFGYWPIERVFVDTALGGA